MPIIRLNLRLVDQNRGRQSFGIDAVNEFNPLFEDLYSYCETLDIALEMLNHEAGAAQMEINLLHDQSLVVADQAFLFKRTVRETALRHKIYATFMAKPMEKEPGSAIQIHQSILSLKDGSNIFSKKMGIPAHFFLRTLLDCSATFQPQCSHSGPNVNHTDASSDIMQPRSTYDGATIIELRVYYPLFLTGARRIENRVPGGRCEPLPCTFR